MANLIPSITPTPVWFQGERLLIYWWNKDSLHSLYCECKLGKFAADVSIVLHGGVEWVTEMWSKETSNNTDSTVEGSIHTSSADWKSKNKMRPSVYVATVESVTGTGGTTGFSPLLSSTCDRPRVLVVSSFCRETTEQSAIRLVYMLLHLTLLKQL